MSRLRLQLLATVVFLLAWRQLSTLEPGREAGILPIDPPTPYIHYLPSIPERGRVLVVHGLDASKEFMHFFSAALADGGFDTYAIDLPGHGDSPVGFNTELAQRAILNALAKEGGAAKTIVVGHSLGATLLLDLAADVPFSTLVLLSPAPTPLLSIHADRILLLSGRLDIPRIREFAPLLSNVGDPHVEWWAVNGAHSSALFNPAYISRIVRWLGGEGTLRRNVARLVWLALMFVSAVVFGASWIRGRPVKPVKPPVTAASSPVPMPVSAILLQYVLAGAAAVLVLMVVNPLFWLKLFATDYLVGFLFLSGIALWLQKSERLSFDSANTMTALAAAGFVILILGWIIGSQALHASLWNGRWWRFICIALAGFPQMAFDETTIRPIASWWKSLLAAILTRGLVWAFLMTGALLFNRESAFLVVITYLIFFFWIALWFAAGFIRRHTQDALAAALFSAVVQGWAFAAWFVKV